MKNLTLSKLRASKSAAILFYTALIIIITIYRETVTVSCIQAVNLCLNLIIPTLFPIQVLMYMILNTGLPHSLKSKIHRITVKLFGLSGNCAEGILLGMIGGYNAAIKNAVAAYNKRLISRAEAKHISMYFSNPGISFCIMIFGFTIYKSAAVGLFVFTASNLISLITAFINRPKNIYPPSLNESTEANLSFSDAFISAVNNAGKTVISVSLWILVFAVIKASVKSIFPFEGFLKLFDIFSDISTGLFVAAESYSLPFCVFALVSGGICIHLQQTEDIRYLEMNSMKFLISKLINAFATSAVTWIALKMNLFNTAINTLSYSIKPISGTPLSSLSLVLLVAVFFSLASEYKKYSYQIN